MAFAALGAHTLESAARTIGTERAPRAGMTEMLGAEDVAWLHMEDANNPMVVNAVLELDRLFSDAALRELAEHLASAPRFRMRVVDGHPPKLVETPGFDVTDHVERIAIPDGMDPEAALREIVARTASTLLDRERPLWRLYALDAPERTTIVVRVHHALADGFALLGVLVGLCDQAEARVGVVPAAPATQHGGVRAAVKAAAHLALSPTDPATLLKGPLGTRKVVAWTSVPLAFVRDVAHRVSATVNDVLVALVSGALRRYLDRKGEHVEGLEIHAMVPVNLRERYAEPTLDNRFGLVLLGLPIAVVDPVARIDAVKERMNRLKGSPEAAVAHELLRVMGRAPQAVEDLGVTFFGSKASLVLTNVPGPRTPLSLGGATVSRVFFWVPQSGRLGLGVSLLSYAGDVTVGVMSDAGLVPEPDEICQDFAAELSSLEGVLGVRARQRL